MNPIKTRQSWKYQRSKIHISGSEFEHAAKRATEVDTDWSLEQAVRDNERKLSMDLRLLISETIKDHNRLKNLVGLKRQQHEMIPDENQSCRKKLSSRFGLVFLEENVIVPKNIRTKIISLLNELNPVIHKMMSFVAHHIWWPKMTDAIQKKCKSSIPCKIEGKHSKPNQPSTENN